MYDAENGGFYSTQDADSEGVEGKFFVWEPNDVEDVIGEENAEIFCEYYDITPHGNFEGENILHVQTPSDIFARKLRIDCSGTGGTSHRGETETLCGEREAD